MKNDSEFRSAAEYAEELFGEGKLAELERLNVLLADYVRKKPGPGA